MPSLINMICVLATLGLTGHLSRRVGERLLSQTGRGLACDPWIVYGVLYVSILLSAVQFIGAVALATGTAIVDVRTLTGILFVVWYIDRMFGRTIAVERGSSSSFLGQVHRHGHALLPTRPSARGTAALAAGIFGLFILEAVTRPPAGWDGLVYHLPLAAKWFQTGSLAFFSESWKFQMPSNGNLIPYVLMYLGNDRFLSLSFVPFLLLGMLAVYGFTRRLEVSHDWSLLAALGFGTTPIALYNAFHAYVDMFLTSFFLCALYLFFWWFQDHQQNPRRGRPFITLAALSFGIALGTKYIYAPLVLFMVLLCCAISLVSESRPGITLLGIQHMIRNGTRFIVWALVPSCFWYLRNFLETGNPMHPLRFSVGLQGISVSISDMPERIHFFGPEIQHDQSCVGSGERDVNTWLMAPWKDCWSAADHFSANWGLGPVFSTFVPVITVVVVLTTVVATLQRRSFRDRSVRSVAVVWVTLLIFLAYWWFFVFTLLRTLLPALGLLFAITAYGLASLSQRGQRTASALFLCTMLVHGCLVAAKPLQDLSSRVHHRGWSRSDYYEIPPMVDNLPQGSVILNASHELKNYPLYGRHLQNRVVTDRALLEPTLVSLITDAFIRKWSIDYIYYDTSQRWTISSDVKCEVIYERDLDTPDKQHKERLCRIDRNRPAHVSQETG